MIHITNPKWRALRLENEASVTYLNRLLRQGWYLMRLDVDGLDFLGFEVPLELPSWTTPRSIHQQVDARLIPTMSVIVLRKGDRKDFQRAVSIMRDASGHFDMATIDLNGSEWKFLAMWDIEDHRRMYLFERGEPGEKLRKFWKLKGL